VGNGGGSQSRDELFCLSGAVTEEK